MEAVPQFFSAYRKSTPQRIKLIDLFLLYIVLTGVTQFVYCALVGTFPFNSFLSGFISCVGSFILTVNLRVQTTNANHDFAVSEERAFADFLFCQVILHLVVMNFLG